MKMSIIILTITAIITAGCSEIQLFKHSHSHDDVETTEPVSHTLYTEKTELFVEYSPLIVGISSDFAAHFTVLGDVFLPLENGEITVSLIVGENSISSSVDSARSSGIFRLSLIPKTAGKGKLVFDIKTPQYTDQIVIQDVTIYEDEKSAKNIQNEPAASDEITYLKEQAWKAEFANMPVKKTTFYNIIKTSGQIISAPGDEVIISSNAGGIVQFKGNKNIIGSSVSQNLTLFSITGGNLAENNLDARYKEIKSNYEKSKVDYQRAQELIKDKIISEAALLQAENVFLNAQTLYNSFSKNYTTSGQTISSPISGFIKDILIKEGQYVEAGTPLAVISKNQKLILETTLSQKYFSKLPSISSANFKLLGSDEIFDTKKLNGKMVTYGKSTGTNSVFIPVTFEIDNIGNLIPGSVAEVFLKTNPIYNVIVIPVSALLEEQGSYFVFIQTGGESFEKREIKTGGTDGNNVQIVSGIEEGERVVTKGAYQIKLSSAGGELPAHSHDH